MASSKTKSEWNNMILKYTNQQGSKRLRNCIATMYNEYYSNYKLKYKRNYSISINPIYNDNILITVPQEAIMLAMNCLLTKYDHIIVMSPLYQSLYQHAIQIGCKIDYWSFQLESHSNQNRNQNQNENHSATNHKPKNVLQLYI